MEKRKFYIMCGIPGSGKSTWARKHLSSPGVAYVSRDEIRFSMIQEGEDYFSQEKKVFSKFAQEIVTWACMHDVIIDATHINFASRKRIYDVLTANFDEDKIEVYCIWMNTPYNVCLARNAQRTGRALVPEHAIESMWRRRGAPHVNENSIISGVWFVEE